MSDHEARPAGDEPSGLHMDDLLTDEAPGNAQPKRAFRRWLIVLGVLVTALVVGFASVVVWGVGQLNAVKREPGLLPPEASTTTNTTDLDDQPLNFLLLGSDSRGDDRGRSDVMMLVHADPSRDRLYLISLPRDLWVPIPGHGTNKINAAYAFGGPELLVQTVEQNTGLQVDGYAEIGLGGFVNAVDAVGGIEMCPPDAIKDRDSNLDIPAGCQQMDGVTALGYVRMRKADPRGDLGRAQRQREMLSALAKKTISPATIALPWRWWGVNSALSRSITIGDDTGLGGLAGIGWGVVRIGTGGGITLSVPVGNPDAHTSAGSSVLWDDAKAGEMFAAMQAGQPVDQFAG